AQEIAGSSTPRTKLPNSMSEPQTLGMHVFMRWKPGFDELDAHYIHILREPGKMFMTVGRRQDAGHRSEFIFDGAQNIAERNAGIAFRFHLAKACVFDGDMRDVADRRATDQIPRRDGFLL